RRAAFTLIELLVVHHPAGPHITLIGHIIPLNLVLLSISGSKQNVHTPKVENPNCALRVFRSCASRCRLVRRNLRRQTGPAPPAAPPAGQDLLCVTRALANERRRFRQNRVVWIARRRLHAGSIFGFIRYRSPSLVACSARASRSRH